MRSLARSAVIYSRIKTTLPKAKQAARLLEELVTLAKKDTLHSARAIFAVLQDKTLVKRMMKEIAPLFKDRNGGCTRIIRLGNRHGDGAQMAILEFVKKIEAPKKEKIKKEKPKPAEPKQEQVPKAEPTEKQQAKEVKEAEKPKPVKEKKEKPKEAAAQAKPVVKAKPAEPKAGGWLDKFKGMFKKKKE